MIEQSLLLFPAYGEGDTVYHKWAACTDPAILCTYVWFTSLHSCSCFCVFSHPVLPDLPTGWEEGYTFEGARCFIKWVGMCRETVIVRGCFVWSAQRFPPALIYIPASHLQLSVLHTHTIWTFVCVERASLTGCCESQAVLLSWTGSTGWCAACVCAGSPGLLTPAPCAHLWTWIFCRPVWRQKAPRASHAASALCHLFYTVTVFSFCCSYLYWGHVQSSSWHLHWANMASL